MKVIIDEENFVKAIFINIAEDDFTVAENEQIIEVEMPRQVYEEFIKGKPVRYVDEDFVVLTEEEFLQFLLSKADPKEKKQKEEHEG